MFHHLIRISVCVCSVNKHDDVTSTGAERGSQRRGKAVSRAVTFSAPTFQQRCETNTDVYTTYCAFSSKLATLCSAYSANKLNVGDPPSLSPLPTLCSSSWISYVIVKYLCLSPAGYVCLRNFLYFILLILNIFEIVYTNQN